MQRPPAGSIPDAPGSYQFKDAQGFVTEEMPFQTLILTENSQETVSFTSSNDKAKRYTVRVRQAR